MVGEGARPTNRESENFFPFTCELLGSSIFIVLSNSYLNMTNSSCQRQKLKTILPIFNSALVPSRAPEPLIFISCANNISEILITHLSVKS